MAVLRGICHVTEIVTLDAPKRRGRPPRDGVEAMSGALRNRILRDQQKRDVTRFADTWFNMVESLSDTRPDAASAILEDPNSATVLKRLLGEEAYSSRHKRVVKAIALTRKAMKSVT